MTILIVILCMFAAYPVVRAAGYILQRRKLVEKDMTLYASKSAEQQLNALLRTPCKPTEAALERIVLTETEHLQSGDAVFGLSGEYYEFFKRLQIEESRAAKEAIQDKRLNDQYDDILRRSAGIPHKSCGVVRMVNGLGTAVRYLHDPKCRTCGGTRRRDYYSA